MAHVLRVSALSAISGYQKGDVRHQGSEILYFLRIRSPYNRTDAREICPGSQVMHPPALGQLGEMLVDDFIPYGKILEFAGALVARFDEDEDTFVVLGATFDERVDAIRA